MHKEEANIRRQLLWPLVAAGVLILAGIFFSVIRLQEWFVTREARSHLEEVERLFVGLLDSEAKFMRVRL
ncbi:MAG: hypothetical protein Q8J76_00775, partial [Desulfobulbaceae bacterium]|nr:hypothetical protein [Desulfobulbaceae bacterium]